MLRWTLDSRTAYALSRPVNTRASEVSSLQWASQYHDCKIVCRSTASTPASVAVADARHEPISRDRCRPKRLTGRSSCCRSDLQRTVSLWPTRRPGEVGGASEGWRGCSRCSAASPGVGRISGAVFYDRTVLDGTVVVEDGVDTTRPRRPGPIGSGDLAAAIGHAHHLPHSGPAPP